MFNNKDLLNKDKNYILNNCTYKFNYNIYKTYEKVGFDMSFVINNDITINLDAFPIKIKIHDYFYYLLVSNLKKYKMLREWFDEDGFFNEDKIKYGKRICINERKGLYKTDIDIEINDNLFICVEFFEHKIVEESDIEKEKLRIQSIVFGGKKYVHYCVFWQENIFDNSYWKTFVKHLIKKIKDYKYINDERVWCINSINEYINYESLSEYLYDSYNNPNEPMISLDMINSLELIPWKNKKSISEYKIIFEKFIKELSDKEVIEDNELDFLDETTNITDRIVYYNDNKLSYHGFTIYITMIPSELLSKDVTSKLRLINFFTNILSGFIDGIKKRYELLTNVDMIYGI